MRPSRAWTLGVAVALAACTATPAPSSVAPTHAASDPGSPSPSRVATTPTATATATASIPTTIAWTPIGADGPAAREDHTLTVSGDGSVALLFGGRDGTTVFGDLWAFSLRDDSWVELPSAAGPPPRFGHDAIWVEEVGLVVFAGQSGPAFFNDLWAYDLETRAWRQLPSRGDVPVARYGSCAAIGPDGRLWMSHGFTSDGARFSDTRAYEFASGTWTDETPAGARPVERCLHGCWWTADGALALFGGQTTGVTALGDRWLLDEETWSEVDGRAAPARNLYAAARLGEATLVFGGQAPDGSYLDDAWWLGDDAADARPLESDGGPPARAGAAMVLDPSTGRGVLFGGRDASGALADVWQFDPLLGNPAT